MPAPTAVMLQSMLQDAVGASSVNATDADTLALASSAGPGAWAVIKSVALAAAATGALLTQCKRTRVGRIGRAMVRVAAEDSESDSETHGAVSSDSPPAPVAGAAAAAAARLSAASKPQCIVVADPVSTGANLADAFMEAGYVVVRITSSQHSADWRSHVSDEAAATRREYYASFDAFDLAALKVTAQKLRELPVTIVAVVSGSEVGVLTGDLLSEMLDLPSNGSALSKQRRDKALMQDCIAAAGLRSIPQLCATSWSQVEAFIDWQRRPTLVLKPARSAGSDGVSKVTTTAAARAAFDGILSDKPNGLGETNDAVLVQEFIEGPEYVVDTVSRNGVHKVVAIYKYDKRSLQRHPDGPVHNFIYFGQSTVSGDSHEGAQLAAYTLKVLHALGVQHGAGHAEVILTSSGPCLVEIGTRPQGNEGAFMPIADLVYGYNQVGALVSATVSQEEFDALPPVCIARNLHTYKLDFVSDVAGRLVELRHLDRMRCLASFLSFDLLPRVGDAISQTVDCFTGCGGVSLVHASQAQIDEDIATIRRLEKEMLVVE